jgi:rhamnulose-1-phosphate aldolase/alcohol dehydrogenase
MQNRWSDAEADAYVAKHGKQWGADLALKAYLSTLIGAEEKLVLHGGGNSSVKTTFTNILAEEIAAILVKASGQNMAVLGPEGFTPLDLGYLRRLRNLTELSDDQMLHEFRTHLLEARAAFPSIETLVHAFIPAKFIDHTHADAILTLTNQTDGKKLVREALGDGIPVLQYIRPGFKLAQAAAAAYEANPSCKAMVWMRHGLLTWGDSARASYEVTVDMVSRAEEYIVRHARRRIILTRSTPPELAQQRLVQVAPVVRGLLAQPTSDGDRPYSRSILQPLITRGALDFVDSAGGKELALLGPLTSDHLIRTKSLPLWIDDPQYENPAALRKQIAEGIRSYCDSYDAYIERHAAKLPTGLERMDSRPRVLLMPGLGAICCGRDVCAARIVRDITEHTLAVKMSAASMGTYAGMEESHCFEMEYRGLQHAKLQHPHELLLGREVALITGAAGAIGSGVAKELLSHGCHVVLTDLPGDSLNGLVEELRLDHGDHVMGTELDVTDPRSVASAFDTVARHWGGVDIVISNAGLAHVSSLMDMQLEAFRRLERVNVEGTLLVLAEAARHFRLQGTGGDIVLVSTKNVFAPGAKFGAYSATKSAAHQLARIASLEMAELGVRVNMVSPDAVFSHNERKSGLWAEVGPERMSARGLDAKGLEEYYRNRNLLKTKVTANHVARAVLFFVTRQTPTTGATIPIDGGLPDATPR